MNRSQILKGGQLQLAVVSLVASAGLTACSGAADTSSTSPTPTSSPSRTHEASAPAHSASPSASAADTVTPVPVESNPPGDIPDDLAFVRYKNTAGGYSFTHPEGWAETRKGTRVRFTDKLNGVVIGVTTAARAPTVAAAKAEVVPRLQGTVPAFELGNVSPVTLPAGKGVHIVFRRNSDPDPVTGKVYRDEVEEYLVFHSGKLVAMDLYGPVGADNVDAYRTMSQSLTIS
jgi:hypothetical protein